MANVTAKSLCWLRNSFTLKLFSRKLSKYLINEKLTNYMPSHNLAQIISQYFESEFAKKIMSNIKLH